jgi:polysaccharide export outer membrane protein
MKSIRERIGDAVSCRPRLARCAQVFTVALLAVGCSTTPSTPPAPKEAATSDYDYVIGPLDVLNIIVWRNQELSLTVPVRPDGKVTTPLVDDLPALGKTPTALARELEKALGKYIRDPVVTVVVTTFAGPASEQIRVIGEAAKPQILAFRKNMTVLDVMIAVGGLTDFADGNAATISRVSEGGKSYSVRLKDLVKRGDISANVDMRPGDILIIPQSWF